MVPITEGQPRLPFLRRNRAETRRRFPAHGIQEFTGMEIHDRP